MSEDQTFPERPFSLIHANHVDHRRQMIGIDGLTITPADIHGMAYAYVIKVFATKLVAIYPT